MTIRWYSEPVCHINELNSAYSWQVNHWWFPGVGLNIIFITVESVASNITALMCYGSLFRCFYVAFLCCSVWFKFCHVNIHVVIIWLIVLVNCEKFTLTFTVCLTVGLLLLTAYSDRVLHTELRAVCGSHLEPICEWFGVLCVPYWTEFMLYVKLWTFVL